MTRRDRLEVKLERREEWAEKAGVRAESALSRASQLSERFVGGQPIIVGHHSEAGARADQERIHDSMRRGIAEQGLAEHHESKAAGLAHQLDRTIFADDDNAIEALEARITKHEAQAARYVELNKAWRKSKGDVAAYAELAGVSLEAAQVTAEAISRAYSWEKQPIPAWQLSNLRARIRTDRERVEQIKTQQARNERAEQAGGVVVEGGEWVRVTFAQKPSQSVLDALRAAGFAWGAGSWCGRRANLPAEVRVSTLPKEVS